MSKICKCCNIDKSDSEFYIVEKLTDGSVRTNSKCKVCVLAYNRKKYSENENYRINRKKSSKALLENPINKAKALERSGRFYRSISGRAKTLYKSACRRSQSYMEFDISSEWIEEKLLKGCCEITGISFDFEPHKTYSKNPYSPSIDRIDSNKGYTKQNVRIVLWQVNLMRGEMSDEEIIVICEKFIKGICEKDKEKTSGENEMDIRL